MTREIEANPPATDRPRSWENLSVFCERFLYTLTPSTASWMRTLGYHFYVHVVESGDTADVRLEELVQAGAHELQDLAAALRQRAGKLPAGFVAQRKRVARELEAAASTLLAGVPAGNVPPEPPASRLFVRQTFTVAVAGRARDLVPEVVPILAALHTHCATIEQNAAPGLAAAIGVALDLHYSAWYLADLGSRYRSCQPLPREKVRLSLLAEEVALTVQAAAERLAATLPEAARQMPQARALSEVLSASTSSDRGHSQAAG